MPFNPDTPDLSRILAKGIKGWAKIKLKKKKKKICHVLSNS